MNKVTLRKGGKLIFSETDEDGKVEETEVDDILDVWELYLTIEPDVVFRDFIKVIEANKDNLRPLLDKYFMDDFLEEAKIPILEVVQSQNEDTIPKLLAETADALHYLVVCQETTASWNEEKNCYDLEDSYDFHAVGTIKDPDGHILNNKMDHIPMSIGFSPVNKFLHVPLVVNTEYEVNCYDSLKKEPSSNKIITWFRSFKKEKPKKLLSGIKEIPLSIFTNVIFDEISFYGPPEVRDSDRKDIEKHILDNINSQIGDTDLIDTDDLLKLE
jgi:hypothetical protein